MRSTLRHFQDPRPTIWFGVLSIAFISILFQTVDWDLSVATAYWDGMHWLGDDSALASFLYRFGEIPAFSAGCLGGLVFLLSYRLPGLKQWRGVGFFAFLLLLLGPGLIVNLLGKGLAGRPRPAQLANFGGSWDFLRPWHFALPGRGQSFLGGHASMGFYWMALYFLAGERRWRVLGLGLGLGLGLLMTWARVAQGGHFLSDNLLAGAFMFTLAATLSPLIHWQARPSFWMRRDVLLTLGVLGLACLAVGHVIYEERRVQWVTDLSAHPKATDREFLWHSDTPLHKVAVDLNLEVGDLEVAFTGQADDKHLPLVLEERVRGLALPGAKALLVTEQLEAGPYFNVDAGTLGASVKQTLKGAWLTASARYSLSLPRGMETDLRLKIKHGKLTIGHLPQGRQVLLNGVIKTEELPMGFQPFGDKGWVRQGDQPQLSLELTAPHIYFEP